MAKPVAIIPARGGSKRIPRKNIKPFHGRPMIGWPIRTALSSGLFGEVIVSTDDEEIAQVARDVGASVPFLRNPDLADDYAGTTEVIGDAVQHLDLTDETPVCCLYATAVFARAQALEDGLARLHAGARWVLSMCEYATQIQRAYRQDEGGFVPFSLEDIAKRSQDLEPAYFDAGQFYWALAKTWRDPKAKVWDGASAVILDANDVCDIDTPADWDRALSLFAARRA